MNTRRLFLVCGILVVGAAAAMPFALATSAAGASGSGCVRLVLGHHWVPSTPKGYRAPYKLSGPLCNALDAAKVGIPNQQGYGVSDVSAIKLPNGQIRLYFCEENAMQNGGNPNGIYSAISSDGVHFTLDPGERVSSGCSPYVYPLPGGGYRLFYAGCPNGGVCSATSSDGLTFTQDPGVRIAGNAFHRLVTVQGHSQGPFCTAIVPLSGGRYRIYCSQPVKRGNGYGSYNAVFSATSSNLLDWTPDRGPRLGPGTALGHDCEHPTVLASTRNGGVTLLCFSGVGYVSDEIIATSKNGLKFTQEADTGLSGSEASAVKTAGGGLLLYFAGGDIGGMGSWAIDLVRGKPSR